MSDTVWISIAPGHGSSLRPMANSFMVNDELLKHASACRARNDAGEPLDKSCFPDEIFGAPHARESNYKLPDLFFAGSVWAVSKAAAEVLRQFDLGGGGLYPVKVFKKDRQTPVGDGWFCINFGNRKKALLASESTSMRERYIRPKEKGWFPKGVINDGDIAVSSGALSGPDIWIDPQVGHAFFLSDALGTALKKAKADKGFFLHKCRAV